MDWDDMWASDLGLPVTLPPNNATLLRPLDEAGAAGAVARLRSFFGANPGGGFQIWSPWPTPDLSPLGFQRFELPLMIRPAGGELAAPPAGLEVSLVRTPAALLQAERVLMDAYEVSGALSAQPRHSWDARLLSRPEFAVFLALESEVPMATLTAFAGSGLNGLINVATTPAARGRGVGAALVAAAISHRPELPAYIPALPAARASYQRLGFAEAGTFTIWESQTRSAGSPWSSALGLSPSDPHAPPS